MSYFSSIHVPQLCSFSLDHRIHMLTYSILHADERDGAARCGGSGLSVREGRAARARGRSRKRLTAPTARAPRAHRSALDSEGVCCFLVRLEGHKLLLLFRFTPLQLLFYITYDLDRSLHMGRVYF